MIKLVILFCFTNFLLTMANIPFVINTWNFSNATRKAWEILKNSGSARDAITFGCTVCEDEQCDFTVGYGGSPDENGETTLDALIFDGTKMDMGAVGGLRRIKNAAQVARDVLEHTEHSILVGDLATNFAKQMGYQEESLSTEYSKTLHSEWEKNVCQPNFWKNVFPDPHKNCGPYVKTTQTFNTIVDKEFSEKNHDTISMIAGDEIGNIVAGTSSNGAKFKIPGRIGDAPLPGAGAYANSEIGGAAATGDGDIMMRFLPSFLAVEEMKHGSTPQKAANEAISRIVEKYPNFSGAVIAVNKKGEYGAACNGMETFPYCIGDNENQGISVKFVECSRRI